MTHHTSYQRETKNTPIDNTDRKIVEYTVNEINDTL